MGHGPAREIDGGAKRELVLSEGLKGKLDVALEKLDRMDPKFKAARDEERFSQITKTWHRLCAEIDGHLRHVAKVLISTHQIALEVGSEGGSINAKPFLDENNGAMERLWFKLVDGTIVSVCGSRTLAKGALEDVTYEWVENVVVDWTIDCVENPKRK